MADVERLARRQRAEVDAVEAVPSRLLLDAYAAAWRRLRVQLGVLAAKIAAAGGEASVSWLIRQDQLRDLENQIAAEVGYIARGLDGQLTAAQADAVRLAWAHAREATALAMGTPPPGVVLSFAALPTRAVQEVVGFTQDGSPLMDLLAPLGPQAVVDVRRALTDGVVLGESTQRITARVRSAFGGNLVRASTVVRTEVARAYSRAAWASYRANRDVVRGWVWLATLSARTCPACLAMHGTEHGLDVEFHDHPRGRCSPAPLVRTWHDLGYDVPQEPFVVRDAEEWFARQSPEAQRDVLGDAKHRAYLAGEVTLKDLAGSSVSRDWGRTLRERSLTEAVGADRARELMKR